MIKQTLIAIIYFSLFLNLQAQEMISGIVVESISNLPISYVSIGVPNQDLGVVSNKDGVFRLNVNKENINDSLKFSCIGYNSQLIAIKDLNTDCKISLEKSDIPLREITISPSTLTKEIFLGNNPKGKLRAGFKDHQIGFECGVLLPITRLSRIKELNCNISECTYDSVYFRVNVYKEINENTFENVLITPIEVYQEVCKSQKQLHIPLSDYNIIVDSSTLITLEYIEDLGGWMTII